MFSSGRRYLAIWLPHWPADRWRRARRRAGFVPPGAPLALISPGQGGIRLTAVDAAAAALGLAPGMTLADARALVPELMVVDADPVADQAALEELADWCGRYAPWTATDGEDGIRLDITGVAHLFGGEAALLADLARRLSAAGLTSRAAIADTPGAAWAVARYATGGIVAEGKVAAALAPLPLGALRLMPETVQALSRVGIRAISDLAALPRAPLALRFGAEVVERLDQAYGRAREPISPRQAPAQFRVRLAFAEAISRREDIEAAVHRLLRPLVADLEDAGKGLRRLDLVAYRVDGGCQRIGIGTAAPSRSIPHLFRLLAEHFDRIDPGFGIEVLALEAVAVDPMVPQQLGVGGNGVSLGDLIDRLQNRLGRDRVVSLLPADSHMPEHAVVVRPADPATVAKGSGFWPERGQRPIALLAAPERIEAEPPEAAAEPPRRFTWRRMVREVAKAEGPERIAPEWWRITGTQRTRDYWRIEDSAGRRYWIYRDAAGWYLQGLFA